MDRATVIVALPPVDDRVNKVSSEKLAHLTMLYLGDVQLSAEAVLYVQHACSELSPFGLSVDYRDKLGEDQADVLFFEKNAWDIERIADFRHWLLLNDEIKRAYDAADQHAEWTPHLTLGYPEAPANDDPEDRRFHYVDFDRIAVWTGDFEGPEFRLKYDDHGMDVAMSASDKGALYAAAIISGDQNALKQYGKKGMKWGVRKTESDGSPRQRGAIRSSITKSIEATKATNAVIKEKGGGPLFADAEKRTEFRNSVHSSVSSKISELNSDPRFKGKDIKYDEPLKEAYHKEVAVLAQKSYKDELNIARAELAIEVAVEVSRAIRSTRQASQEAEKIRVKAMMDDIKHAEEREVLDELTLSFERDDLGHIVDVTMDEIKHYGKKGMKWGVRNDNGHQGEQVKTKKLEKLDKKWEADMNRNAYMKMYNAAADKMNNGGIDAINNKPEYKDADLSKPGPLRDKYDAEHELAMHNAMVEAGPSLGMNPSGTKQFVIKRVSNPDGEDYDDVFLEPVGLDLQHAEDVKVVAYRLNQDETGHTTSMEQVELELKHYGVKGMKWGVTTKDRAKQTTPTPVTVEQKKPGVYAKSKGGKNNPMTDDARKSLEARQKAKASTTDALSNKELQEAVNRMQLEQRYKQLEFQSDRRSRGARFVAGLFGAKRYDGKDIKFKDSFEEQGGAVRDAIQKVVDEKAKATTS